MRLGHTLAIDTTVDVEIEDMIEALEDAGYTVFDPTDKIDNPELEKVLEEMNIPQFIIDEIKLRMTPPDPLKEKQKLDKWVEACRS